MIGIIFQYGSEVVKVDICGKNIIFTTGMMKATIEGLKLDYNGVCKEFPDLAIEQDWRKIAIERFKEKMANMKTEKERAEYLIQDLRKVGYIPLYIQKGGFRPIKLSQWKMGDALGNLLSLFIILALFIIIYCKVTQKTLIDLLREIRDINADEIEYG